MRQLKTFYLIALVSAVAGFSMAAITLDFNVNSAYADANRLFVDSNETLDFDFTVNGSGSVTLNATYSGSVANIATEVNGWDGVVGTLNNANMYNTSFSLSVVSVGGGGNRTALQGNDTGVLACRGTNSGRIDGAGAEDLVWSITSGSGYVFLFNSFDFGMNPSGMGDFQVEDSDTTETWYNQTGTTGTHTLNNFSITGSQTLTFTTPGDASHGYGLAGLTFGVVPEPATVGLIIVGAIVSMIGNRIKFSGASRRFT